MKPDLIVSTFMSSTAAYSVDGKKYRYFYEHLVGHASLEHFLPLVNHFNEYLKMRYSEFPHTHSVNESIIRLRLSIKWKFQ